MRYHLLIASALALGACAPRTGVSPQEMNTPDAPNTTVAQPVSATVVIPTQLMTVRPAYITAWSSTTPDMRVYFTDNATVITPNGTYTGWNDVNTRWVTPLIGTHYTITPVRFDTNGNAIVETGTYTYRMNHGGSMMDMKGNYTYNWTQQPDGSWRISSVTWK